MDAYIFDNSTGRIRILRDDDPQVARDAASRANGSMLMLRPVVYADGRIMGELAKMEDTTAKVTVHREGGVDLFTVTMPVALEA